MEGTLTQIDLVAKFGSGKAAEQEVLVFEGLLNDYIIPPDMLDLLLHVVMYPWPLRVRAEEFIQTSIMDMVTRHALVSAG